MTTPPPGAITGIGSSQYDCNQQSFDNSVASYGSATIGFFDGGGGSGPDALGQATMSFAGGASAVASGAAASMAGAAPTIATASGGSAGPDLLQPAPGQYAGASDAHPRALLQSIAAFDATQPHAAVAYAPAPAPSSHALALAADLH